MFELCSCTVAIGGDIRSVVAKPRVTPAEIMLLQSIHGTDAVTNIKIVGEIDSTMDQERDRLGRFYKDEKVINLFNQFGDIPQTLEAARIPAELLDPAWKVETKKAAPKKKAVKKRARNKSGHFVADDPTTEVNEAYEQE